MPSFCDLLRLIRISSLSNTNKANNVRSLTCWLLIVSKFFVMYELRSRRKSSQWYLSGNAFMASSLLISLSRMSRRDPARLTKSVSLGANWRVPGRLSRSCCSRLSGNRIYSNSVRVRSVLFIDAMNAWVFNSRKSAPCCLRSRPPSGTNTSRKLSFSSENPISWVPNMLETNEARFAFRIMST